MPVWRYGKVGCLMLSKTLGNRSFRKHTPPGCHGELFPDCSQPHGNNAPNRLGILFPAAGTAVPDCWEQQSLMLSALTMPRLQYLQICADPSTYLAEEQEIPAPLTWNRDWLPVPECPHPFGDGGHEGTSLLSFTLKTNPYVFESVVSVNSPEHCMLSDSMYLSGSSSILSFYSLFLSASSSFPVCCCNNRYRL